MLYPQLKEAYLVFCLNDISMYNPAYVAPEVIIGIPYSTKCDLWSIGCILYMLIGGYPPFKGANHRELFRKVRAADFVFHDAHWKNVSVEAKRVISNLLCVNPDLRWGASEALQSDWFLKSDPDSLRSCDLSGSLREIQSFRAKRTWKSAVQALRFAAMAPFWNADATRCVLISCYYCVVLCFGIWK